MQEIRHVAALSLKLGIVFSEHDQNCRFGCSFFPSNGASFAGARQMRSRGAQCMNFTWSQSVSQIHKPIFLIVLRNLRGTPLERSPLS
jgi:hypothetical protein